MSPHHAPLPFLLFLAAAAAQGAAPRDNAAGDDPLTLVGRGEKLLQKGEKEDGLLLLWQALDGLAGTSGNAAHQAAVLSARFLLNEHDPLEPARRELWTLIARRQVELAAAYRQKKWFDTAATRIDVASLFDDDAAAKEREALAGARPKGKPVATTPAPAAPTAPAADQRPPLLQPDNVQFRAGSWRDAGPCIEAPAYDRASVSPLEWVCKASHADHEVVAQLRPASDDKDFNVGIALGLAVRSGELNYSGYRCYCQYFAEQKAFMLLVTCVEGSQARVVASASIGNAPAAADGFRRLSAQVRGASLRVQLDALPPLEITAPTPLRGNVGLVHGLYETSSCVVVIRDLRVEPLPTDAPSDEELRQQVEQERQHTITAGVDRAKELLTKKQPEAAATALRETIDRVQEMAAGVLRDNLGKSIETMLQQADPLAARRKKAAQTIAADLVVLADKYAADGRVRMALALLQRATAFDPDGTTTRLAAAEAAVEQWNLAQATARAAELAPPADDGALLRQWFADGKLLDSRRPPWVVDGPCARVEHLSPYECSVLMPKSGLPPLGKARVAVHLPGPGTSAGFALCCAGPHDFSVAMLLRVKQGLRLEAHRYADGRWSMLATKTVPMDAWRLDGWFSIDLEALPAAVVVRAAGARLDLDNKRLAAGVNRYGLYVGNDQKEPATVEVRAFTLPQ